MSFWSIVVEAVAALFGAATDWLGGNRSAGILAVSLGARSALIPLLLPLAMRTRDRLRVVRRIRPEIKALDREFRDDPSTHSARLKALHEANGIQVVDWYGLVGAFVQLPVLIALFQAVLIVWPPEALTLPGAALGVVSGLLSVWGARASGQTEGAPWMSYLFGLLPLAICLWLGAGVGIYLTGFYAASAVQALLMRRADRAARAA